MSIMFGLNLAVTLMERLLVTTSGLLVIIIALGSLYQAMVWWWPLVHVITIQVVLLMLGTFGCTNMPIMFGIQ
jgi:hypothetical protein